MPKSVPKTTDAQIAKALISSGGVISQAARDLGRGYSNISRRILLSPYLQEIKNSSRNRMLDVGEMHLRRHVEAGDMAAIRFTLQTLGRDRGYGVKTQIEAVVEGQQNVVIYLPDNGRDDDPNGEVIEGKVKPKE